MKNYILLIALMLFIMSCNKNMTSYSIIKINNKSDTALFGTSYVPFSFLESTPSFLKGVPKLDTSSIQYLHFYSRKDRKKLNLMKAKTNTNDKNLITGIYAFSGFKNNKQVLIIDKNNNLNFSDDKEFVFTKKLRIDLSKKTKIRHDSFSIVPVIYNSIEGNQIIDKKAFIRPFPYVKYFTYKNPNEKTKIHDELQIVSETTSYRFGEFNIDNRNYKVAFKRIFGQYKFMFQTKDKAFLKISDSKSKTYKLKDTVKFSKTFYRIDSVNFNETRLFLKKLNIHAKIFGYQISEKVSGFKLNDIRNGNSLTLDKLLAQNEYVLLDFWGTWCAPCKELTPYLVKMNSSYPNVNILSIAFQKNKTNLLKYIADHKMDWNQALVKGNAKRQNEKPNIIKNLAIEAYPTFILIDKNKKIIYRGTGKPALNEIENIIKNNTKTNYK